MEINRKRLVEDLRAFCVAGSGIVIGKPGVGKSHMIRALKKLANSMDEIVFIIRIDNIDDASDESIGTELGISGDWLSKLAEVGTSLQKPLLIFDSFDSVRDEGKRSQFLSRIKQVKQRLADKWNIVVSVRTYDATKSPELIKLFPKTNSQLGCRTFEISPLSTEELQGAMLNAGLNHAFENCTNELKAILHIPYFLILFETTIQDEDAASIDKTLKTIRSEAQLLDSYWTKKIVFNPNYSDFEELLFNITNQLVKTKTLSFPKTLLYDNKISFDEKALEYLFSENILENHSVNKNRIGFAHNILFDFAISKLILSQDVDELSQFVSIDVSRPFFLRPSFIYFFTQIWYVDRTSFWSMFFELRKKGSREIQLLVKVLLMNIVALEYRSVEDVARLRNDRELVQRFLQSIQFVKEGHLTEIDVELLFQISSHLELQYGWEFAILLEKAIEQFSNKLELLGIASRNLFSFLLDSRESKSDLFNIDRLASMRGIDLVCRTFQSDIERSGSLMRRLFKLLNENDFEIRYFSSLIDKLQYIIKFDVDLVEEIYRQIFGHKETSDKTTNIGASATLNLTSSRRQDYELCHYALVEFFPTFLNYSPEKALRLGLAIVNKYVIDDQFSRWDKPKPVQFKISDIDGIYISDHSSIWSDSLAYHRPAQIIEKIFEYFESLVAIKDITSFDRLFRIYFENAKVGLTWNQLIKFAIKHAEHCRQYAFPLCTTEVILLNTETQFEIATFIKENLEFFDKSQRLVIELKLVAIYDAGSERNGLRKQATALLQLYKEEWLQTDEGRKIASEAKKVPIVESYTSTFSSEPYTTEDYLRDRGVDTEDPENAKVLASINEFQQFYNEYLNETPNLEIAVLQTKAAIAAFDKLQATAIPQKLIESAWQAIVTTIGSCSRNYELFADKELTKRVKHIAFTSFDNYTSGDTQLTDDVALSRGYGPTIRTESSDIIVNLYLATNDDDARKKIISASHDSNPVIRFAVLKKLVSIGSINPELHLKVTMEAIKREKDAISFGAAINGLRKYHSDAKLMNEAVAIFESRRELLVNTEYAAHVAHLLLELYEYNDSVAARKFLYDSFSDLKFCSTILYRLFIIIQPGQRNDYLLEPKRHEKMFGYLLDLTKHVANKLDFVENQSSNPEYNIYISFVDYAIQRIYFSFTPGKARQKIPSTNENKGAYYLNLKPILNEIINVSSKLPNGGLIVGHTAYYFMQIFKEIISFDPKTVLKMTVLVTKYSYQSGFTFDSTAIKDIVHLTEILLADHRDILLEKDSIENLIELLDFYINSGWTDALRLLYKLDSVFR